MLTALLGALGRFDAAIFEQLRSFHAPVLDWTMAGLSEVARGGRLWMAIGLFAAGIRPSRWSAFVLLLLAIGLAALLATTLFKPAFGRSRPFETQRELRVIGPRPDSRSFPSSHAATSFAGAYAMSHMVPGAAPFFWTLAVLVGFSRIYLGVHYPLDVVAGALVGLAAAAFVVGGPPGRSERMRAAVNQRDSDAAASRAAPR